MLEAARAARNTLNEAAGSVVEFILSRFNEDGGAKDRSGKSDLYYTVFAIESLLAMRIDPPLDAVVSYLRGFGDGDRLDFVHRSCLARCWASLPNGCLDPDIGFRILERIESHRSADGVANRRVIQPSQISASNDPVDVQCQQSAIGNERLDSVITRRSVERQTHGRQGPVAGPTI